jgi:Probable lipoprotein LpqN
MNKSAAAVGVAIAAISLTVGLVGCGKQSKSPSPSTSSSTSTSTSTSAKPTSTSAQAAGPNETIADYIKKNNIQDTPIAPNTPGAPTLQIPVPDGWSEVAGPSGTYGLIKYDAAANPQDPPTVTVIYDRLNGNVETEKLIAAGPGEARNLPGFQGDGKASTMSGFPAYQISGSYVKDGAQRVVAQKTVVIEGKDGVYVLQLNAEGPDAESGPLGDATNVIDDKTTITAS